MNINTLVGKQKQPHAAHTLIIFTGNTTVQSLPANEEAFTGT